MSETGHHAGLPYHVDLLSDPWRASAWKAAIQALIQPGDVVLDVGTGTGIMAVWAAQAGAGKVIAVESSDVAAIAARTMERNGVADVVEVVAADIATLEPHPVDVILCDFVGRLLPDAAMRRAVAAAGAWAHDQTRWAPGEVRIMAAPVAEIAHQALDRLEIPLLGVDLSATLDEAYRVPWSATLSPEALLSEPVLLQRMTPPHLPIEFSQSVEWTLSGSTRLRGVAAWFEADLAPGITLGTGPGKRTFWRQILWPGPLTTVQPEDRVRLQVHVESAIDHIPMSWTLAASRDGQPIAPDTLEDTSLWMSQSDRRMGEALLAGGRPTPAIAPLLASGAGETPEGLSILITALASAGDPAAWQLLAQYEAQYGPHPTLRRG